MNWDAMAAVGQMLGSIAVLATLWYLAVQVRHARREVQRSVTQNRGESGRELNMYGASNERGATIAVKAHIALGGQPAGAIGGLMTETGLTFEEAYTFNQLQLAWWNYREQVIENIAELPVGQRTEFDNGLRTAYSSGLPANRLWYEHSRANLNPAAVRYVDNLLAQPRSGLAVGSDSSTLSRPTEE